MFSRTKHGADKIVRQLEAAGIPAGAIHGNKSQPQRERALAAFKSGQMPVLVATDIAARGIDIPGVSHVVNFDLPDVPEQYVHRIGRTARAGAEGIAIAFCCPDERINLRDIERLTRQKIAEVRLPEGFLAARRGAQAPQAGQDGRRRAASGRIKADRRADGQRRDHRNRRARSSQPKRAARLGRRGAGSRPASATPVRAGRAAAAPPAARRPAIRGHRPDGARNARPAAAAARPFRGNRGGRAQRAGA